MTSSFKARNGDNVLGIQELHGNNADNIMVRKKKRIEQQGLYTDYYKKRKKEKLKKLKFVFIFLLVLVNWMYKTFDRRKFIMIFPYREKICTIIELNYMLNLEIKRLLVELS